MNRREWLQWMTATGVVGASQRLTGATSMQSLLGTARHRANADFVPDVELSLVAEAGEVNILPGAPTRVWRFSGSVIKGPPESLKAMPNSYLGPVIRLRRGQQVRIRFRNALPESTIVHWHGLDVPEAMDGHPRLAIATGDEYVYEFEVINRAGTYWYHPHPHGRTGAQVYQGLAGMLLVTDDEESAAALPSGDDELLCVLQDRQFDAQNQLVYARNGMMDRMQGFVAERVLVNGTDAQTLGLATRAYRLRVLNGSSARVYKLAWDDGTPMTIIGGNSGLLERPHRQAFVTLAPAQRVDLIVDLSARAVGSSLQLLSAPFPASDVSMTEMGMGGMGRMGGMGGASAANGTLLPLLSLQVARRASSTFRMPERLSTYDGLWTQTTDAQARRIVLTAQRGAWLLGGREFEMTLAAPDEEVQAGGTQIWEIVNAPGMMGMHMAHPFHVHGKPFRILDRQSASGAPATAGSVREGLVDAGWTDTVLVLPGETVRIQTHFSSFPGLYLYHCHLLEHEDMGMMRNFRVLPN